MMGDLFTIFDYSWGASFSFLSLSMWFSSLLIYFFTICFLVYWFSPNFMDSVLIWFMKLFGLKMSEEVKWMGGTPHLFVTLFLVLLSLNVSGNMPYHYPLSAHFLLIGSFALPFWFATVFLYMSPNWRLVLVGLVQEGGYLVPNAMVMLSEVVSFLARPLTLTCRLVMNVIIGQIIMSLIGNVCVGLFLPFFWYEGNFGSLSSESKGVVNYFFNSLIVPAITFVLLLVRRSSIFFIEMFMFVVELAVSVLQACIFTGLLVFYVYEAPLKLSDGDSVATSAFFK
uniref:ATP synthase subunit a n=1 Tax=Meretrix lusoria TaxID=74491 RepID=E5D138_MERLU|nr:ATP synthase F0 subunit 6 [Meretrix lusoria]ACV92124.1 ATP synthase F0 subunit 6 [Meretrix lusoria]